MKKPGTAVLLGVSFGAINLMSMAARLEAIRAVDVVRLIGVGMCFGVALVGIVIMLRKRQWQWITVPRPVRRVDGLREPTSRTPAGSPAVLEPKVDSLPLRRAKHRVGSILLEWTAARAPLSRRRRGRSRRRYLFRLANKESMRNREDEGLLGLIVGQ